MNDRPTALSAAAGVAESLARLVQELPGDDRAFEPLRRTTAGAGDRHDAWAYTSRMLARTHARTLPVLNRAVDVAPAAQACCGACRTCMTTNILTATGAAFVGAASFLASRVQRSARRGG